MRESYITNMFRLYRAGLKTRTNMAVASMEDDSIFMSSSWGTLSIDFTKGNFMCSNDDSYHRDDDDNDDDETKLSRNSLPIIESFSNLFGLPRENNESKKPSSKTNFNLSWFASLIGRRFRANSFSTNGIKARAETTAGTAFRVEQIEI